MPPFIHRPTDAGFDSRRYATKRRYSNFGYYDMPAVNDAMTFMLPPFQTLHSRLVRVGPKLWQLWSPNSPLNAFYPGIRAPGYEVKMEDDEEKRRFDGHLGRFDPTRSPQHFDARHPWLGFVRRDRTTSSRVEHIPSFLAWESLPPHNNSHDLGKLDTAFIIQLTSRNIELEAIMASCEGIADIVPAYWADRPIRPVEDELRALHGTLHFSTAVDTVAAIQRGLKLKSAWARAIGIMIKEKKGATYTGWIPKVPVASEEFLGVWINGTKEEEAMWLLSHKIPCFIIHEVPPSDLFGFVEDHKYLDFVTKTDALFLHKEHNGFDHLAVKTFTPTNESPDQGGVPRLNPVLRSEERGLSGPTMQGWMDDHHAALGAVPEVIMRPVNSELPPVTVAPSPIARSNSSAPEPETMTLATDRVEWLVPPPVMSIPAGKWTRWEEWVTGGDDMFFRRISSEPQGCEEVYFDRKERRQIYVVEPMTIPPGVVSDMDVFGVPAPTARFVEVIDNQIEREYIASHWLYKQQKPTKGSAGMKAPIPNPQDLPLLSSLRRTSKAPAPPIIPETVVPASPILIPPKPAVILPLTDKPIPTEPRAHRQQENSRMISTRDQLLGRRPRTSVDETGPDSGQQAKKPRADEDLAEGNDQIEDVASSLPVNSSAVPPESSINSPVKPMVVTLSDHSTDSRFLCFEGLKAPWKECCSWFYGVAVSSHIVWISRMYRTVEDSRQLVWVEMGSNEDACKFRGYLTHRTMPDNSLVISHFVSDATFQAAIRNSTNKWLRPTSHVKQPRDDPMEGSSSRPPLEERLVSPSPAASRPSSPTRDVTLLHRTGVTLEERVEGTLPRRHFRGGVRHKKNKHKKV